MKLFQSTIKFTSQKLRGS